MMLRIYFVALLFLLFASTVHPRQSKIKKASIQDLNTDSSKPLGKSHKKHRSKKHSHTQSFNNEASADKESDKKELSVISYSSDNSIYPDSPSTVASNVEVLNPSNSESEEKEIIPIHPGKIRVLKKIGKGGYSNVYLIAYPQASKHLDVQRYALLAFKRISKKNIVNKKSMETIRLEAGLVGTKALRHHFLLDHISVFQDGRYLFMVSKFMLGGDLAGLLKSSPQKRMDPVQASFYAAQIVLALNHLHQNGIIHCDVKPGNILIDQNGYVRLTDFGLARRISDPDEVLDDRRISGTLNYFPPEVVSRTGYSRMVDWYLLGATVYRLVIGEAAYRSKKKDKQETYNLIKEGNLKFPSWFKDAPTEDFIRKLMRVDPKKRLGAGGVKEIMQHEWFNWLDWNDLNQKRLDPPYVPPELDREKVAKYPRERLRLYLEVTEDANFPDIPFPSE